MTYKRKDLKKNVSRDPSTLVWDTPDNKYYVSTADVEDAMFHVWYNNDVEWELIFTGHNMEDCIEQINFHHRIHLT